MGIDTTTPPRPGRDRAFVELIQGVEGELRGFLRQRVGSGGAAHDLVQKTFLRAWADPDFDPTHPNARAWMFTTARRLALDWLRSAESQSISLDDLSERLGGEASRGSRSALPADRRSRDPLVDLIDQERGQHLEAALAALAADRREVLVRYYLQQEGGQLQIAAAMGLSVAAFNSRLNRARQELKRAILILRGRDGGDEAGDGTP